MNLMSILAKIYFRKITVSGNLKHEPGLYVSNHRIGAIDGLVLSYALGEQTKFIVGRNLTKYKYLSFIMGNQIDIYRQSKTMEELNYNRNQLKKAAALTKEGYKVVLFPEGTSHLNRGLLPIKKGAALMVSFLDDRSVIPIGLHYEKGWSFRSDVFVRIGERVEIQGKNLTVRTDEIRKQLESVYDPDYVFPTVRKNRLLGLILSPIVLLFYITNILVLLIPYLAANRLADDLNVICLWRMLFGVPLFMIQSILYLLTLFIHPLIFVGYILITMLGFSSYGYWKKLF